MGQGGGLIACCPSLTTRAVEVVRREIIIEPVYQIFPYFVLLFFFFSILDIFLRQGIHDTTQCCTIFTNL